MVFEVYLLFSFLLLISTYQAFCTDLDVGHSDVPSDVIHRARFPYKQIVQRKVCGKMERIETCGENHIDVFQDGEMRGYRPVGDIPDPFFVSLHKQCCRRKKDPALLQLVEGRKGLPDAVRDQLTLTTVDKITKTTIVRIYDAARTHASMTLIVEKVFEIFLK